MKCFKIVLSLLLLLVMSCGKSPTASTDEGLNLPANVKAYSSATIYQKGQYVYSKTSVKSLQFGSKARESASSDGVYQATTRIVGKDPVLFSISETAPLNPWKPASFDEAKAALENTEAKTAPTWEPGKVYNAGDIVISKVGKKNYKSLWWNQDNDPDTAANQNANGNWGPWKPLTPVEAEKELGAETGNSTGSGSTENNTNPGSNDKETVVPPGVVENPAKDDSDKVITEVKDPSVVSKYEWKSNLVYLENNVCLYGDNYYRAKWWTQGDTPQANPKVAWDTPWQKINEDVFLKLAGGNIPPEKQPANDNSDAGIPNIIPPTTPPVTPPSEGGSTTGGDTGGFSSVGYDWAISKGYVEKWTYNSAPSALTALKTKLNDAQIFTKYGLNGNDAAALFSSKLSKDQWGELFKQALAGNNLSGYYSYENFIDALKIIGKYAYVVVRPSASNKWQEKCYVIYKNTGESTAEIRLVFQEGEDFTPTSSSYYSIVDYAAFGTEGSANDKIRVIAGFLAHASHETSGSWATAPAYPFNAGLFNNASFTTDMVKDGQLNGMLAWSLWFNEEVAYKNLSGAYYVDAYNKNFPPYIGANGRKASSYHGRGAFQLSWNYNYGLASAIFFGDARVLNKYPESIVDGIEPTTIREAGFNTDNWQPSTTKIKGGTMAFLTSLMFWLTPQGAKPSQQDTMILNRADGRYVAGTAKLTADASRGTPGYGWTINIMNGGFEAGKSWQGANADAKVRRRVLHYQLFVKALGGSYDGEVLDTYGKTSY